MCAHGLSRMRACASEQPAPALRCPPHEYCEVFLRTSTTVFPHEHRNISALALRRQALFVRRGEPATCCVLMSSLVARYAPRSPAMCSVWAVPTLCRAGMGHTGTPTLGKPCSSTSIILAGRVCGSMTLCASRQWTMCQMEALAPISRAILCTTTLSAWQETAALKRPSEAMLRRVIAWFLLWQRALCESVTRKRDRKPRRESSRIASLISPCPTLSTQQFTTLWERAVQKTITDTEDANTEEGRLLLADDTVA